MCAKLFPMLLVYKQPFLPVATNPHNSISKSSRVPKAYCPSFVGCLQISEGTKLHVKKCSYFCFICKDFLLLSFDEAVE